MAPTTCRPPVLQRRDVSTFCNQPALQGGPLLKIAYVSRKLSARRVWRLASALELTSERAASQVSPPNRNQAHLKRAKNAESGWPAELMQRLDASASNQSYAEEVEADSNTVESSFVAAREQSANEAMSDLLTRLQVTVSERPATHDRAKKGSERVARVRSKEKGGKSQGLRAGSNSSITSKPSSKKVNTEGQSIEREKGQNKALASEVGPLLKARWRNPNSNAGKETKKRARDTDSMRNESTAVDRGANVGRGEEAWTANREAETVPANGVSPELHEGQASSTSIPGSKYFNGVVASLAERLENRGESEQPVKAQAKFEAESTRQQLDRRRQSHQKASTSSDASQPRLPPSLLSTFNLLNREDLSIQEVIDSLKIRKDLDSGAWGALLVQLAWKGNLEAALRCHESLVQEGVKLTASDQLALVNAIGHSQQSRYLVIVLKHFREAGSLTTAVVNAFLVAFNKCGEPKRVLLMFQKLGSQFEVDHTTYHEVLKACQELHLWETAVDLLAEMEKTEMWPDVTDYTMGITACARARRWTKALDLLDTMESLGCPCNTAAINSAINACARVGEWRHALRLLFRMPSLGVQPNVVTWSSVITACGQGPASSRVIKQVLNAMLASGCEPNDFSWTASIDAFGRLRDWRAAQLCFASVGNQPSPPVWCALITAYGDAGQWTKALAAFESMRKAGLEPDTAHWTAVIRAVGSRKAWLRTEFGRVRAMRTLVQALYTQMKTAGCVPNEVTYTSMIRIHGRSFLWRKALSVFNEALMAADRGECVVTVIMFNALASAYAESGCFNRLWNLVMTDMDKEYGVSPDRITYTILIKACVQNNKGRILSGQVYRKMQECGVKPDAKTFDWLAQGYEHTGLEDRAWNVLENMSS